MLKVGKRSRDSWNSEDMSPTRAQCSPHKMISMDSTPTKRPRYFGEEEEMSNARQSSPRRESMFGTLEEQPIDNLDQLMQRRKPKTQKQGEKLYTHDEVKEIINRVLAEREAALRTEYDRILQERLQEQYQSFSKFNEDYISRQMRNRPNCDSYIS